MSRRSPLGPHEHESASSKSNFRLSRGRHTNGTHHPPPSIVNRKPVAIAAAIRHPGSTGRASTLGARFSQRLPSELDDLVEDLVVTRRASTASFISGGA